MPFFRCLGSTKVSVQVRGFVWPFRNIIHFYGEELLARSPNTKLEDHPCLLSATACSIYSQLFAISEAVTPSATWGHTISSWQGHTYYHESPNYKMYFRKSVAKYYILWLGRYSY
jgi:hypothetical protein